MGRIVVVHGDHIIEPEPEPVEAPEMANPFTEEERRLLLERRLSRLIEGTFTIGGIRADLMMRARELVAVDEPDLVDGLLSLIEARQRGLQEVFATYLRELMLECGQAEMFPQRCSECGRGDDDVRSAGCWIEADLCMQCADRLLSSAETSP
jgi:hypothetical protein